MGNPTAWGEESPSKGSASSWQNWKQNGNSPTVTGDADWGKLSCEIGDYLISNVVDTGNTKMKVIRLTPNVYGTGDTPEYLRIRGSVSSFNQDDETPAWEEYSANMRREWRYIQARIAWEPKVVWDNDIVWDAGIEWE